MIQRRQQSGGADGIHLTPELRLILIPEDMTAEDRQLPAIAGDGLNEEGAGQRDPLRQQRNARFADVQLLHAQRQPGHAGHHDALQIGLAADIQQPAVFPVLGQGVPGVIPVFRQRQAGDGGQLPIHQRNQLAAAGKVADDVTERGGQKFLNEVAFRLTSVARKASPNRAGI